MRRFTDPDAVVSMAPAMCAPLKDKGGQMSGYSREFQTMLDRLEEEDCCGAGSEKKRRLSLQQVHVLEKYFEVENKLEPERKARLADQLGLHPRQVAVWFQNRRARWKTKQLERDYALLKSDYDALRLSLAELEREKAALNAEVKELKGKLSGNDGQRPVFVDGDNPDHASFRQIPGWDSDSVSNLKEELCSLSDARRRPVISPAASSSLPPSPPIARSPFSDPPGGGFQFQRQWVKTAEAEAEEGLYGAADDACNFLSVDQSPTLYWYGAMDQ